MLLEDADQFPEENLSRVNGKISQPYDCVIATKATIGRLAFLDESSPRVLYSPQVSYWRVLDDSALEPRFIRCWLVGREFENQAFQTKSSTSMADYINLRDQRQMRMTLPPLETQRKIAAIVAAYDELIENNSRRIEILEEMVRAIYREWFVSFRYPGNEDDELVDSPLGPIPESWEVRRLDQIAALHRGRSYRTANLVDEGGWPFVNLKCIDRDGGFRRSGLKRYEGPIKPHQLAHVGDLVVALTDMTQERRIVARAARVPKLREPEVALSMDLLRVEPTETRDLHFVHGMLRFSSFPDEVKQYANGANVLHLSPDRIAEFEFLLPPRSLRHRFAAVAEPLVELSDNLELQNENLRVTRDLLLPKLVSGEIDVSDLDIDTSWLAA